MSTRGHLHGRDIPLASFSALLDNLEGPSRPQLFSLVDLVLEHPHQADELWSVITKALRSSPADSERTRALWYLRDLLLKRAGLLLQPLAERSGFTSECCVTLPWSHQQLSGSSDRYWVNEMVQTWEHVLPPSSTQSLMRIATARKTQRELEKLKGTAPQKAAVATRTQLDVMQESWLKFIDAANGRQSDDSHHQANSSSPSSTSEQLPTTSAPIVRQGISSTKQEIVKREPRTIEEEGHPSSKGLGDAAAAAAEGADDDDDLNYEPLFAFGGERKERPLGAVESKRDRRKRQRAQDDDEED